MLVWTISPFVTFHLGTVGSQLERKATPISAEDILILVTFSGSTCS